MVRIISEQLIPPVTPDSTRKKLVEVYCKSTDTKPTSEEWVTGSVLIEVDTGTAYFYEEEADEWHQVGGGSDE